MSETVERALTDYLGENGFSTDEYTSPTAKLYAGPFSFRVPNPKVRQRAIPFHDLHHVATGYGTDVIGEGEIGAWELAAGCPSAFLLWVNGMAAISGFFLAPSRVMRAFRAGRGAKTLYERMSAEDARALTVTELRAVIGLPSEGVADPKERHLHGGARSNVA